MAEPLLASKVQHAVKQCWWDFFVDFRNQCRLLNVYRAATEPQKLKLSQLAEHLKMHIEQGFSDTRVLTDDPGFQERALKLPLELVQTHCCLVLGQTGSGKTTLVNALTDSNFRCGPVPADSTKRCQASVLRLSTLSDIRVFLIDTEGWAHDKGSAIKSAYKEELKQKHLASKHTPHIIIFCVQADGLRNFQSKEAAIMSRQFQELKFDQQFPVVVLPVATFSDTIKKSNRDKVMNEVYAQAKAAFTHSGAEVKQALHTQCEPDKAPEDFKGLGELKKQIGEVLQRQMDSDGFQRLWSLAFAESLSDTTAQYVENFRSCDSEWRLFEAAFRTVCSACDKEVKTQELTDIVNKLQGPPPWWIIREVPRAKLWMRLFNPLFGPIYCIMCIPAVWWIHNQHWIEMQAAVCYLAIFGLVLLLWSRSECVTPGSDWWHLVCFSCRTRHFTPILQGGQDSTTTVACCKHNLRKVFGLLMLSLFLLACCRLDIMTDMLAQAKEGKQKAKAKLQEMHNKLDQAMANLAQAKEENQEAKTSLQEMHKELDQDQKVCLTDHNTNAQQCYNLREQDADDRNSCIRHCCSEGTQRCDLWQYSPGRGCWLGKSDEADCSGPTEWQSGSIMMN